LHRRRAAQFGGGLRQILDVDARQLSGECFLGLPHFRQHHAFEERRREIDCPGWSLSDSWTARAFRSSRTDRGAQVLPPVSATKLQSVAVELYCRFATPVPAHAGQVVTWVSLSRGRFGNNPSGGLVPRYLPSTVADWALESFVVGHSAMCTFCCKGDLALQTSPIMYIQLVRIFILQLFYNIHKPGTRLSTLSSRFAGPQWCAPSIPVSVTEIRHWTNF
jgi:hypothetical protein